MPERLLVVGGSGFIGRHVAAHALTLGWNVVTLGMSGRSPAGMRNVLADIADAEMLRQALGNTRFDYVVNCGGYIDHTHFSNGGHRFIGTHFNGVLNLVKLIDRQALKRFVNMGSSDEYGKAEAPQSESMRESPISPYSLAKAASTHFLQMMHRTESFPAVTLRLFLTYGPGQDQHRFLPQIIRACLRNRSFPTSDGGQLRDFCFVDDTVQAVFASLQSDAATGEVINIGSGQGVSIRSVIEAVCRMTGGGTPRFGLIPYRSSENMQLYADVSKAASLLAWKPKVCLEQGLRRTIDWHREVG